MHAGECRRRPAEEGEGGRGGEEEEGDCCGRRRGLRRKIYPGMLGCISQIWLYRPKVDIINTRTVQSACKKIFGTRIFPQHEQAEREYEYLSERIRMGE